MPKKILYLFGAGASQAVVTNLDPSNGLMPKDIQTVISGYSSKYFDPKIWNEIITDKYDLEHIISVLEYQYNYTALNNLRRHYRNAILELAGEISRNPPEKNLYSVLIDMHTNLNIQLQEELLGVISLNYEDILERTAKKHFKLNINYGIEESTKTAKVLKILKLHGSFNWRNVRPIKFASSMANLTPGNTLWIPPGVDKRKEHYPFNILWGKASEMLLECDILRVVGCSLSRNDWGLIPMLYTLQKFHHDNKQTVIEIIDFPETGEKIRNTYNYLDIVKLDEIKEFLEYYRRQMPSATPGQLRDEIAGSLTNPFQQWLETKIEDLLELGEDIHTKKDLVWDFYYKM